MSSGDWFVVIWLALPKVFVGVEVSVDGAGEVAFEASQGFFGGFAVGESFAVVALPGTVGEPKLCDRDAVQGGVELTVAGAVESDSSGGVS